MTKARAPAILETPRMTGEPIGPEHETELAELTLDPRVYRTLWPWSCPPTRADVQAGLTDKREHWERYGFGLWLLRDRFTGVMVGRGGVQYTDAIGGFAVEAAWAIAPERWGQGLATELATASVTVAFEALFLDVHEVIRHHTAGQPRLAPGHGEGGLRIRTGGSSTAASPTCSTAAAPSALPTAAGAATLRNQQAARPFNPVP